MFIVGTTEIKCYRIRTDGDYKYEKIFIGEFCK